MFLVKSGFPYDLELAEVIHAADAVLSCES